MHKTIVNQTNINIADDEVISFTRDMPEPFVTISSLPETRVFDNTVFITRIHDKNLENSKASAVTSVKSIMGDDCDIRLIVVTWPNGDYGILAAADGVLNTTPNIYKKV
jgi:hypothetical protein